MCFVENGSQQWGRRLQDLPCVLWKLHLDWSQKTQAGTLWSYLLCRVCPEYGDKWKTAGKCLLCRFPYWLHVGEKATDRINFYFCTKCFISFDLQGDRRPKLLPCEHSFCLGCIKTLDVKDSKISCPECQKEHTVPNGGVSCFPTNEFFCTMLNIVTTSQPGASAQPLSASALSPAITINLRRQPQPFLGLIPPVSQRDSEARSNNTSTNHPLRRDTVSEWTQVQMNNTTNSNNNGSLRSSSTRSDDPRRYDTNRSTTSDSRFVQCGDWWFKCMESCAQCIFGIFLLALVCAFCVYLLLFEVFYAIFCGFFFVFFFLLLGYTVDHCHYARRHSECPNSECQHYITYKMRLRRFGRAYLLYGKEKIFSSPDCFHRSKLHEICRNLSHCCCCVFFLVGTGFLCTS